VDDLVGDRSGQDGNVETNGLAAQHADIERARVKAILLPLAHHGMRSRRTFG
jgi:hypothetical protein